MLVSAGVASLIRRFMVVEAEEPLQQEHDEGAAEEGAADDYTEEDPALLTAAGDNQECF